LQVSLIFCSSCELLIFARKCEQSIKKAKRIKKLFAFESKNYFLKTLKSSRKEKIDLLKQFTKVYSDLLYTFFNETE
jgi:hypothetical protein